MKKRKKCNKIKNNINDFDSRLKSIFTAFAHSMGAPEKEWDSFENDLLHNFRFSSNSVVIDELHKKEKDVIYTLNKGSILYRSRIYNESPYDKLYLPTDDKYFNEYIPYFIDHLLRQNQPSKLVNHQRTIYNNWIKSAFKGYNAKDSGAPPVSKSCIGRANPEGIRYLYLSEDIATSVYEIRPIIGQLISYAAFRANRELKIYDFTKKFEQYDKNVNIKVPSLFDTIGKHFSLPYKGSSLEYLPTQYLTEEIRRMGFDGLRFKSSLKKDGINVVIFNPDDFTAYLSHLAEVTDINLEISNPVIYTLGQDPPDSSKDT